MEDRKIHVLVCIYVLLGDYDVNIHIFAFVFVGKYTCLLGFGIFVGIYSTCVCPFDIFVGIIADPS